MLSKRFQQHLLQYKHLAQFNKPWLIAVSGGIDSVVLCHLAHEAQIDFAIAHCNFQLRGDESLRDENFVITLGERYSKCVLVERFDTEQYCAEKHTSTQVAARQLRYNWFRQLLHNWTEVSATKNEYCTTTAPALIVTAHHANDNIETLLMNFFKGTGISGLHGIQPLHAEIFRPLLPFKKEELLAYAQQHQLTYVEDSSNKKDTYTRNYFRQHLLPLLSNIYPKVEDNLLNNIERFSETEQLYQQAVQVHKTKLLEIKGAEVHIPVLKLAAAQPLRTIVFEIVKDYGFTAAQVNDVVRLLKSDSGKYVQSSTHRILKNRRWLIISPLNNSLTQNIVLDTHQTHVDFEAGTLSLEFKENVAGFDVPASPFVACIDAKQLAFPLLLRKWKQGDYFYPLGMKKKKKKLSKFFIDKKLSLAEKEQVWIVESNKKIVWIAGHRMDERFKVEPATSSVVILSFKPHQQGS